MDAFFHPASIGVIGASARKGGHNLIRNLLYGYQGAIYPVNPNYKEIEGLPCFPSPENIPNPVDLAIILVPAPAVPGVLKACGRKGVRRVMIESAGFAEVGEAGKVLEDRCKAVAGEAGIRIWGPNCMGLVGVPSKHFFTFMLPHIYEDGLIPGRISMVAQSGMLSAAFLADLMSNRSIGVGKVCSIGNKADVDECDLLSYLMGDPETDVIALYLESLSRGRLFAEIIGRATKPVVVLKGGKSEAGARAAMSHTSSLAGNSRLLEEILKMSGATLANDFHQMIDLSRALASSRDLSPSCRTAILTFSGGAGILSCDLLEKHSLQVTELSERSRKALAGLFPEWMPVANPVDLYPAIERHGRLPTYDRAISIVLEDPNVDVLLVHYVSGLDEGLLDLVRLKKRADAARKKILFWSLGRRESTRAFREAAGSQGFFFHGEISRTMECLAAAARFQGRSAFEIGVGEEVPFLPKPHLQEFDVGSRQERIWDEYDSKTLLNHWDIPVVEEVLLESLSEGERKVHNLGWPLVLKGLLPGKIHKSELGLIRAGINSQSELAEKYLEIQEKLGGRGRILVQRQVDTNFELIAGFLRDTQFGPCVMFGLGGILAELEPDITFALAPLTTQEAIGLVRGIRGRRLLEGFRGMAPLRENIMAEILVKLGALGSHYPQIAQIDINPFAVTRGNPIAVDATVILGSVETIQEQEK